PCLVLVKSQQSTKIYGGYNPLQFTNDGGQWKRTNDSFIFSFESSKDIQDMIISRVNSSYYSNAIYECSNYGFSFGNTTFYMNSDHKIYFSNQGYYDNNINNVGSPYIN
ncbi:hypothetical protein RhiirA1_455892, partial [Rhizophagus irregularis]